MRPHLPAITGLLLAASVVAPASAHFLVLQPSTDTVTAESPRAVIIDLRFTHPMERGPAMEMEKPVRMGVKAGGEMENLLPRLKSKIVDGKQAWEVAYTVTRPEDLVFFVEPAPYWEPAEQKMIVHYTKVVVDAFGGGHGWDDSIGFPVEIQPLVRPYGLWAGNLFRGIVKRHGEPVPFADVEVEWLNDGTVTPPNDAFVTQVVKTDAAGEFAYAMPRAGWWGFAALVDGDKPMNNPDGKPVDVELGALMWVRTVEMR